MEVVFIALFTFFFTLLVSSSRNSWKQELGETLRKIEAFGQFGVTLEKLEELHGTSGYFKEVGVTSRKFVDLCGSYGQFVESGQLWEA